ncbi:MAG: hypothetical protein HYZ27_05935 [Deltaproteobacteria bacterium]|nr:hypothetical protein [Deltaproteobacteria bacterium]
MDRSEEFRKHVNDLWKQAVKQLEEAKEVLLRQRGRIEADLQRLRLERDKLLKKLGEQTYKFVNNGRVRVPEIIKRTVDRLNEVINRMVKKPAGKAKGGARKKKPAARRRKA